ncbi:hypothetical protein [Fischerella sp. PCC 9605]|uniref:hypothetical protein n=1 Tax=Fischerella sp. PCC 9605 TaxID=1173024 RepID=UPI00047B0F6D|nr:hypothetical protein [Fischerella sp. PCC 9605]
MNSKRFLVSALTLFTLLGTVLAVEAQQINPGQLLLAQSDDELSEYYNRGYEAGLSDALAGKTYNPFAGSRKLSVTYSREYTRGYAEGYKAGDPNFGSNSSSDSGSDSGEPIQGLW